MAFHARSIIMRTLKRRLKTLLTEKKGRYSACRRFAASSLVTTLLITFLLISCAARETEEPVTNTDAVTPGAAAHASEPEPAPGGTQDTNAQGQPPSGPVVASASRDDDTWSLVTDVNAERKFDVYVDTSTIQNIEGEVYSWSKLVFKEDQKDSDGLVYREVMISSSIDCAKNTYSYKSSKFYDSLGKMVYMENIATNKSEIPSKSVSRHIADFVCGYDPNAAKKAATPPAKSK
jgi:hypothetical protein